MVEGNINLNAKFHVRQLYDFSKAYAISFRWWGVGGVDLVDLRIETPTGNYVGVFPDGATGFREVLLHWGNFNEVAVIGTRPDKSRITAILWTVHTPGVRRLDRFAIVEVPYLRCFFVIRRSTSGELKAGFTVRDASSEDLKSGFAVS